MLFKTLFSNIAPNTAPNKQQKLENIGHPQANHHNLKKGHGSKSGKIFLLKWGISIKFFKKYYLKSNLEYKEPLKNPKKNILYFFDLIKCKFNYLYLLLFYKKYGKIK